MERSAFALRPRARNMRLKPVSSSVGISDSGQAEPASTTSTERPAAATRAATTPPPAPLPTTTTSASRSSRVEDARRGTIDRHRPDGRGIGPRRLPSRSVAHRGPARVGLGSRTRVGVGQEERQPLEGLERRSSLRQAARPPAQQVSIARLAIEVAESDRAGAEDEVGQAQVERAQGQLQLPEVDRLCQLVEGCRCQPCHPRGVAGDETVECPTERRQVGGGPASGRRRIGDEGHPASNPCAGNGGQRSGRSSR